LLEGGQVGVEVFADVVEPKPGGRKKGTARAQAWACCMKPVSRSRRVSLLSVSPAWVASAAWAWVCAARASPALVTMSVEKVAGSPCWARRVA